MSCGRYQPRHLIKFGLYFNRPASELVFLTRAEHNRLHTSGRLVSDETKAKLSAALSGRPGPNKGKKFSAETCRKISEALKGKTGNRKDCRHSVESKLKISAARKGARPWNKGGSGYHWFTNGVVSIQAEKCPEGFSPGRRIRS